MQEIYWERNPEKIEGALRPQLLWKKVGTGRGQVGEIRDSSTVPRKVEPYQWGVLHSKTYRSSLAS